MTLEPIKEPKTLWDHVDSSQWIPLFAEIQRIKENKPKLRRQRGRKDIVTNIEEIEQISEKALDLNIELFKRKGGTPKRLLRKLNKVEKFSEKYLNKLDNIYVHPSEKESSSTKKLEVKLFIMRMRYNALKSYYEKLFKVKFKIGTS